jgi:hypothetical protein
MALPLEVCLPEEIGLTEDRIKQIVTTRSPALAQFTEVGYEPGTSPHP